MKRQWKLAEAPAIEAIRQAQSSSRIVMETLRLWAEMQALDSMPAAETGTIEGEAIKRKLP
jgi:hypothetical protein